MDPDTVHGRYDGSWKENEGRMMTEENLNNEEIKPENEGHDPDLEKSVVPELDPKAKAEKDAQFEKEFMPLISSLYNFAYRLTLDEDDANDLVQETYLKAYRFFASYEQGTNAKAWLFRILKNSFINDFRKKSKQPSKVDYQEVESFYNSDDVDENITVDLRIESIQDMIGDEVATALNALAVDFRTIIILCDLEGFTYEEMAKILDIPIGTVRSRLHRARNLLKEKLKEYAGTMGYNK